MAITTQNTIKSSIKIGPGTIIGRGFLGIGGGPGCGGTGGSGGALGMIAGGGPEGAPGNGGGVGMAKTLIDTRDTIANTAKTVNFFMFFSFLGYRFLIDFINIFALKLYLVNNNV
jgi:hypothetical protein